MYFISNEAVEVLDRRQKYRAQVFLSGPDKMVRKITFGILHAHHFVRPSYRRDIVFTVKIFLIKGRGKSYVLHFQCSVIPTRVKIIIKKK